MPRSPRTKLALAFQKVQKEIAYFRECIRVKEEQLEEIRDVIRTKGSYAKRPR